MTPDDPRPTPPPAPPREITLEEWIAATQSCCGIDLPAAPTPCPAESET